MNKYLKFWCTCMRADMRGKHFWRARRVNLVWFVREVHIGKSTDLTPLRIHLPGNIKDMRDISAKKHKNAGKLTRVTGTH